MFKFTVTRRTCFDHIKKFSYFGMLVSQRRFPLIQAGNCDTRATKSFSLNGLVPYRGNDLSRSLAGEKRKKFRGASERSELPVCRATN